MVDFIFEIIIEVLFEFIMYIIGYIIYACFLLLWNITKFFYKTIFKKNQIDTTIQQAIVDEEVSKSGIQPQSKMLIKPYQGRKHLKAIKALRKVGHNLSHQQASVLLHEGGEIEVLDDMNNLSDEYQILNQVGISFDLVL